MSAIRVLRQPKTFLPRVSARPFLRGLGLAPSVKTQKEHLWLALAVTCSAVRKIHRCSSDIPYLSVGLSFPRVQR